MFSVSESSVSSVSSEPEFSVSESSVSSEPEFSVSESSVSV